MFGPHSILLVCYGAMNSLRVKDVQRPRDGCVNNLSIICNVQETFLIRRTRSSTVRAARGTPAAMSCAQKVPVPKLG
jgi:hypothetical protein